MPIAWRCPAAGRSSNLAMRIVFWADAQDHPGHHLEIRMLAMYRAASGERVGVDPWRYPVEKGRKKTVINPVLSL